MSSASQVSAAVATSVIRRSAGFHPSLWGNHFLTYPSKIFESTTQEQHKMLKEEVRKMITTPVADKFAQKGVLQLIDAVQRLGVAYHFEKDIEDALVKIFRDLEEKDNIDDDDDDDLYIVTLRFRLLRQQGIKISCDVFNKFKDEEGKYFFKDSLMKDVKGMLSLYEATYLGIHEEEILDEAMSFATTNLKSMIPQVCPNLAQQINHALDCPIRKALPRIEARWFLDIYATDDLRNQTLLKFAKLDFNVVQDQHQQELSELTRWWRDLNVSTKLPYARDRLVEVYLMITGVYFEPKYVLGRNILTRVLSLVSVINDTFDAHGTFAELQLFTEEVKRWDTGSISVLPEYMKVIYKALLDLYNEIEKELIKEGRSHCVRYAKEKMQELVEFYFREAKWLNEQHVPTMEEYYSVALGSSTCSALVAHSFLGMGVFATEDAFKWVATNPKIVTATEIIGRLLNDIEGHEAEQVRGHIPSAVECYMSQYAVSQEEAVKVLNKEVENAWKDINQEYLVNPNAIPFPLLDRSLNLSRVSVLFYKNGERFTNSYLIKDQVASLFKDPVIV